MRDLYFYHELEDMMEEQLNDCFEMVDICGYKWDQGSALRQLDEIAFDQEVSRMVSDEYQEIYIDDMSEEEAAHYGISHNQVMYCHLNEMDEGIMRKSDFNGFHNSFAAYCEWCEANESKMSWGDWWDGLE